MEKLLLETQEHIRRTPLTFKRYLLESIHWNSKLIAIKGARGVGKTTLLLQRLALNHKNNSNALYVSLEHPYFYKHKLIDLAEEFSINGGKFLFMDEVHKYPNWSREIKLIYDNYPEINLVFTSSSILDIYKGEADLSRRAISYTLDNLSLREFINFNKAFKLPSYSLEDIVKNHVEISTHLIKTFKPILEYNNFTKYGAYPYFKEDIELYHQKLISTINLIIEVDIASLKRLDTVLIFKAKQLLYAIATSAPFTPNISKLSERISVSRQTLIKALKYLEQALLINNINKYKRGISSLNKPDKILLQNTNLGYALAKDQINIGTIRETFFVNQLKNSNSIHIHDKGDYIINNTYIFEIGEKSKTQKQIKGLENAYLVKDNMEVGINKSIPLWLFGFLY